jgi:catechol 2,3-dioxygenase-like lactoylglutathione lyase family enzyme
MAVLRRILETALYCDDLKGTTAFYERLLGATPTLRTDRVVAFDVGEGTVLLLFRRGHTRPLQTEGGLVPGHDGNGPAHLAFAIDRDEIPVWELHLAALDVEVESRVTWTLGGLSLYFRDPDGRSIELATPGTWPSY